MLSDRLRENNLLKLEKLAVPKQVTLEVTTRCNYNCYFCVTKKIKRAKGFIDFEFAKRILKDLVEFGVTDIGFEGAGEPMLYPHLPELIKYAKELGFTYTFITTNGNGASDEAYLSLLDKGLDSLKFSINATNSEEYTRVHNVKPEFFDIVIKRMQRLIQYNHEKKLNTKLYVSCVGDHDINILKNLLPGIDEILHYDLVKNMELMDENGEMTGRAFCNFPFVRSEISLEGYVKVCCKDRHNFLAVGDLHKQSFAEIWNGELYENIRTRFLKNDFKGLLCESCMQGKYIPAEPLMPEHATYPQLL